MTSRRVVHAIAVAALGLAGRFGANDLADGTLMVGWGIYLDGSPVSCSARDITQVELVTTEESGFGEIKQRFACDAGRGVSNGQPAGTRKAMFNAFDSSGMLVSSTAAQTVVFRSGISIPVSGTFLFLSPPTTGSLTVQWTLNGGAPNGAGNCPAASTVQVDLDGGATQEVGCAVGGVLFSMVAPGPHTIAARLGDGGGLIDTQAGTPTVTAGGLTNLALDFVF